MTPPGETTPAITRAEAITAGALLLAMLVLRWFYRQGHLWDSDETQHLHVVWAWATGRLPYRDVFDNHSPLFHLLNAPLFAALGERADIVEPMRFFAMTPLWLASLALLRRIGAALHSPRNGLWTALLGGAFPAVFFIHKSTSFFLKMGEFRTDVLWVALWLGALAILVSGPLTARRMFCAGLVFGACFAVSMKTVLLLLTVLAAGLGAGLVHLLLRKIDAPRADAWAIPRGALAALGGVIIVPALFIAWFAAHGALREMYQCVILHNVPSDAHSAHKFFHQLRDTRLLFLPPIMLGGGLAFLLRRDPIRAVRAVFFLLAAGFFYPLLHGFWSKFTPQDYLPWYPLLAIVGTPLVLLLNHFAAAKIPRLSAWALPAALVASLFAQAVRTESPFGHPNTEYIRLIDEALRLTDRNETLCDAKGETVFRPRPYFPVLETLTRKRLSNGELADELPASVIAHHTAVAYVFRERMMPGSIDFLTANYLPVGLLSVLGKMLTPDADGVAGFDLVIPETYRVESRDPDFAGTLDGQPIDTPRVLAAGHHELRRTAGRGPVAVVWARAHERGFSPFDVQGRAPVETLDTP